jgi:hypothetical protein
MLRGRWGGGYGGDTISSTGLDIIFTVIAAAAAVVAVWRSIMASRQANEARKSRELSAVISLFNAYQSEDASRIRRLIRDGTISDRLDDREFRFQLRSYINQLNFIATVRARHLLSDELVHELFFEGAKLAWDQCGKSFIREIRETENDEYAKELQEWIGAPDP